MAQQYQSQMCIRDRSVIDIYDELYHRLGGQDFRKLFPVILTDNGSEFSNPKLSLIHIFKEKMEIDNDVQRLKLLKASYDNQRYGLQDNFMIKYPKLIKTCLLYTSKDR